MSGRPVAVNLIAIWFFLTGTGTAIGGGVFSFVFVDLLRWFGLAAALTAIPANTFQVLQILFILIGVILIASGLGYWVSGVGLLQGKEWGRIGGIISAAGATLGWFAIGIAFFMFLGGQVIYPAIFGIVYGLFSALPILYLISAEAQTYCLESQYPTGTRGEATTDPTLPTRSSPRGGMPVTAPGPLRPVKPSPSPRAPLAETELISPTERCSAWLIARSGAHAGQEMPLNVRRNTIGRDGAQCNVLTEDSTVSQRHAEIRFENGQYVLYDLASTNGTYVNGHLVHRQALLDGDEVRLGRAGFIFKEVKLRLRA